MEYLTARKFSFTSTALPEDTFGVVSFTGTEELSRCYEFDVTLVSENLEIDFGEVVQKPATLTFHRKDGGTVNYHGLILHLEQMNGVGGVAFYRAHLVPRLYCLSYTVHNQIFLGQTVQEVVTECLKDGGLTSLDFEFRLEDTYDPLDYVCQYGESHLNFVSRWLEHEGIYYFFEQTDQGEKVIFTDTQVAHTTMRHGSRIRFSPPSGLEAGRRDEIIRSFTCKYSVTPAGVMLKDYNYRKPSLDVTGLAQVDGNGRGQVYSYGEHIRTPEQGNRLARIMAERLLSMREVFEGEGSVPYMSPGFTYTLKNHYRPGFNRSYLTTEVRHEGNQAGYLLAGLARDVSPESEKVYYRNTFHAIPSSVQFRPERKAVKPRMSGIISGRVDAAGSGKYAQVDSQGRYKVILPFDTSGRKEGKASKWIRMATPYAGSGHGMNLPLHKGTEVLIAFMDGDADRPVIIGAVPNPETQSLVTTDNQTMSVIQTASQNKIAIEDKEGSERMLLHTPNQGSYVRIGAPNDPEATDKAPSWKGDTMVPEEEHIGIKLYTNGLVTVHATAKNEVILGGNTEWVAGVESVFVLGATFYTHIGEIMETSAIARQEFCPVKWEYNALDSKISQVSNTVNALSNRVNTVANTVNQTRTDIDDIAMGIANIGMAIADSQTQIAQDYTTAITDAVSALATRAEVATAKQEAVAESTTAIGEVQTAIGEQMTALGTRVTAIGEQTDNIASRVTVLGESIETSGEKIETTVEKIDSSVLAIYM